MWSSLVAPLFWVQNVMDANPIILYLPLLDDISFPSTVYMQNVLAIQKSPFVM